MCALVQELIHHAGLTKLPAQLSVWMCLPFGCSPSQLCTGPILFCFGLAVFLSQMPASQGDGKSFPYLMGVLPALVTPCQGLEAPISAHLPASAEEVCVILVFVPLHIPAHGYASRVCALWSLFSLISCNTAPCNSAGLFSKHGRYYSSPLSS